MVWLLLRSSKERRRARLQTKAHSPARQRAPTARLVVFLAFVLGLSGCEGCRPETDGDRPEDPELEDFESSELYVLPTDEMKTSYGMKPGHWYAASQRLKSNRTNFDGELEASVTDASQTPLALHRSQFRLISRRPASLPKGQGKSFDSTYLVPHSAGRRPTLGLRNELRARYGGAVRHLQQQVTNRLRAHQAFLAVLAHNPDEYNFVRTLESIQPPGDELILGEIPGDYLVVMPRPEEMTPLPAWPMMWTSIAYIMWDDFDPELLSRDQQRSLVDWLHWGGQLIISGPNSLDSLRTSFLRNYLPADAGSTQPVSMAQLEELNTSWSVPSKNRNVDTTLTVTAGHALEAITLVLRADSESEFVPGTAHLVAERRVGRGRVAVTGFSLSRRELTNWRSFDNFFNASLLRRPSRRYVHSLQSGLTLTWNDSGIRDVVHHPIASAAETTPSDVLSDAEVSLGGQRYPNEALLTTRLRYFSRDAAAFTSTEEPDYEQPGSFDVEGYTCDGYAGIAGWNDQSECSRLARDALTFASGIVVPNRSFIMSALGLYLIVLVPINWSLFRALGHVEWAWLAVPVLAVVGTVTVAHLAQLDIGFVRSRTEIAVMETQPGYARGHATRYIGLYTSLSTDYQLSFDDDSAVAAPLSTAAGRYTPSIQATEIVGLQRTAKRGANVQLRGLSVSSNSTEMVHAEQMVDLQGEIRWNERPSGLVDLINDTPHALYNVGVVRRRRGKMEFAGLPSLPGKQTVRITFRVLRPNELLEAWSEVGTAGAAIPEGIELSAFQQLAATADRLHEGDVRLAGWNDSVLDGLSIEPQASQQTFWTFWVANLRYGPLAPPRSDTNTRTDFAPELSFESADDRAD